jgi:hypothetical protein
MPAAKKSTKSSIAKASGEDEINDDDMAAACVENCEMPTQDAKEDTEPAKT